MKTAEMASERCRFRRSEASTSVYFICYQNIPNNYFSWKEFTPRLKGWMDCVEDMELDKEYYEVSNMNLFKDIIEQNIIDVVLVEVSGGGPIGIKVIFENDYILSRFRGLCVTDLIKGAINRK